MKENVRRVAKGMLDTAGTTALPSVNRERILAVLSILKGEPNIMLGRAIRRVITRFIFGTRHTGAKQVSAKIRSVFTREKIGAALGLERRNDLSGHLKEAERIREIETTIISCVNLVT